MIDITGLNKAEVLAALHNNTSSMVMGFLHALGRPMTIEEAEAMIKANTDKGFRLYFDYVYGKPLKVDLTGNSFEERLFDRDAGAGAAARAIDSIRGGR